MSRHETTETYTNLKMRHAFLVFIGLFLFETSQGETVYLGAPPPGTMYVEARSVSSQITELIAGTTNPPRLSINGQSVALKSAMPSHPEKGVWVNGQEYPTQESVGRFFIQLESTSLSQSELSIVISDGMGKEQVAHVPLNHFFLEAPIYEKQILPLKKGQKKFLITFSGRIEGAFELKVTGRVIKPDKEGRVEIPVTLTEGRNVLAVEFRRPGSSKRIINLPLIVTKTEFDPDRAVLNIEDVSEASHKLILKGLTNPGAGLKLNGNSVDVKSDGRFEAELITNQTKGVAKFDVLRPSGSTAYDYAYLCKSCEVEETSTKQNEARAFVANPHSLGFRTTQLSTFVFLGDQLPGNVLTSYSPPLDFRHVGVSHYYELNTSFKVVTSFEYGNGYDGYPSDEHSLRIENLYELSSGLGYSFSSSVISGVSLMYLSGDAYGKNFTVKPDSLKSFGLLFYSEGDFRISSQWSYAPKISLSLSGLSLKDESPASWFFISMQLLGVHYHF
jgi:hypothetical protein